MNAPQPARRVVLGLTMGEPAGIGGQIALKAWHTRRARGPVFCMLDDPDRLAILARRLGLETPIGIVASAAEATHTWPQALPVLPHRLPHPVTPGQPDPANASCVMNVIQSAVRLAQSGAISAVVTNPIHKQTLYGAGFSFPGHTEYLGAQCGAEPVMMLAIDGLRTVPVTTHMALSTAVSSLSQDRIVSCARITAAALSRDFGIAAPRLAVAGLNPHAGEGGAFGAEEATIITPAIEELRAERIDASGPYPADSLFHESARANYDAAICMYHDQALIPVKCLDFDHGVNVTLGLPFVRTSPDHGTALDIADTDRASPESLLAALDMAASMAERRRAPRPAPAGA